VSQLTEKARNRLKEIEQEAERLRVFLAVAGELEGDESTVDEHDSSSKLASSDSDTASPSEIIEAVRLLIEEKGRPLGRGPLVKALRAKGLNLPGADPAKNVGTVIWRSKQFDNIAGFGYWPKSKGQWIGQRQRDVPA